MYVRAHALHTSLWHSDAQQGTGRLVLLLKFSQQIGQLIILGSWIGARRRDFSILIERSLSLE